MFKTAVRSVRPALLASHSSLRPPSYLLRFFSTSLRVSSGGPPPQLLGPGGKTGEIPDDIQHATGLARLQLLGQLDGVDVFDERPLDSSRIGTKADPILVSCYDVNRLVGCTGSPADSHEVSWLKIVAGVQSRCWECGSVYKLHNPGKEHDEHPSTSSC